MIQKCKKKKNQTDEFNAILIFTLNMTRLCEHSTKENSLKKIFCSDELILLSINLGTSYPQKEGRAIRTVSLKSLSLWFLTPLSNSTAFWDSMAPCLQEHDDISTTYTLTAWTRSFHGWACCEDTKRRLDRTRIFVFDAEVIVHEIRVQDD